MSHDCTWTPIYKYTTGFTLHHTWHVAPLRWGRGQGDDHRFIASRAVVVVAAVVARLAGRAREATAAAVPHRPTCRLGGASPPGGAVAEAGEVAQATPPPQPPLRRRQMPLRADPRRLPPPPAAGVTTWASRPGCALPRLPLGVTPSARPGATRSAPLGWSAPSARMVATLASSTRRCPTHRRPPATPFTGGPRRATLRAGRMGRAWARRRYRRRRRARTEDRKSVV